MSLFSRLEERMRARDTQDESKDKEPEKADDAAEGGLFGAIQLGPRDENVVVRREVPSIEEARAEFDRAKAAMASGQSPTDDENASESEARETVSFGAVTLPPIANSAFASDSVAPAEPQLQDDSPVAAPDSSAVAPAAETAQIASPSENSAPDLQLEIVATREETPFIEAENSTRAAESSFDESLQAAPVAAVEAPESLAPTEEKTAPAARAGNNSNLTPFQRLMAARAAQGGSPLPRPRVERPAPATEATIVETPLAEDAQLLPQAPVVENSRSPEPNADELLSEATSPVAEEQENASAAMEAPQSEIPVAQTSEIPGDAPAIVTSESDSHVQEVAVDTIETPAEPKEQIAPDESQTPRSADAPSEIVTGEEKPSQETAPIEENNSETESAPENTAHDENLESPVLPSLAERLANAPRAELEAARAEAQGLVPEILSETPSAVPESAPENNVKVVSAETVESANVPRADAPVAEAPVADVRTAAAISFAERLAARKRADNAVSAPPRRVQTVLVENDNSEKEDPEKTEDSASLEATPESRLEEQPRPESSRPEEQPRPEASRSAPRSFSERLAARTGLDRNLQMPSEEAPASRELANANAELARIDEGAQLSEREMKNRVLFRQKYLIFDAVVGAIDARVLQNPTRENVKPQIERGVDGALREFNLNLESFERNWMVDEFVRETTDLGALVPLLEDPSVSKIVVTGANDVSVERLGRIERTGVSFRDDDHLLSLVRRIAELSGGRVDAKVPLLDRPLPDGGRIRAKVPPLAPQPTLTIEKSTGNPFVALKRQNDEKSRGEALPYAQLRERIQQRLLREFEGDAAALVGDQDKLRLQVEEMIGSVIAEERVAVTRAERASLVMDLLNEIVGLGPIEPLLNDPDVDEVMVNGPYQIYVERKGKLELTSQRFRDNAHVMQVIDRIVAPLGRRVDEKSPMVDGRLRDGSRFNAIIPPLALSGPTMTIRKFARDPFTMSDLINFGTMTREAAQFLQAAVEGRLNVVVSGGTGSGKTTTLNVLSSFIPSSERIVTIEDAAELQMRQEHVIRMETRPPNIEGVGEIGIRDLVRNSLRMRPDRIVVGECRGGEALDMLQAMNTGHDGSLTTAHSNGPRDTCKRLETMVLMAGFDLPVRAIREQISMAVQLIVHQERMRDGKRRVTAITEIVGMEGDVLTLQDIFRFAQEGIDEDGRIIGSLQATGMRPKYYETIVDNGVPLSMELFAPRPHEATPRARLSER